MGNLTDNESKELRKLEIQEKHVDPMINRVVSIIEDCANDDYVADLTFVTRQAIHKYRTKPINSIDTRVLIGLVKNFDYSGTWLLTGEGPIKNTNVTDVTYKQDTNTNNIAIQEKESSYISTIEEKYIAVLEKENKRLESELKDCRKSRK